VASTSYFYHRKFRPNTEGTLDPLFDEEWSFIFEESDMKSGKGEKRLSVAVWDWDRVTSDDFMYGARFWT
jgi:hypothetical protein